MENCRKLSLVSFNGFRDFQRLSTSSSLRGSEFRGISSCVGYGWVVNLVTPELGMPIQHLEIIRAHCYCNIISEKHSSLHNIWGRKEIGCWQLHVL